MKPLAHLMSLAASVAALVRPDRSGVCVNAPWCPSDCRCGEPPARCPYFHEPMRSCGECGALTDLSCPFPHYRSTAALSHPPRTHGALGGASGDGSPELPGPPETSSFGSAPPGPGSPPRGG